MNTCGAGHWCFNNGEGNGVTGDPCKIAAGGFDSLLLHHFEGCHETLKACVVDGTDRIDVGGMRSTENSSL